MVTVRVDKVMAFIRPEDFKPEKWRHPVAQEPIKMGQILSVNLDTEKVSLYRPEILLPPDGAAMNDADVNEPVTMLVHNVPGESLIGVFLVKSN